MISTNIGGASCCLPFQNLTFLKNISAVLFGRSPRTVFCLYMNNKQSVRKHQSNPIVIQKQNKTKNKKTKKQNKNKTVTKSNNLLHENSGVNNLKKKKLKKKGDKI